MNSACVAHGGSWRTSARPGATQRSRTGCVRKRCANRDGGRVGPGRYHERTGGRPARGPSEGLARRSPWSPARRPGPRDAAAIWDRYGVVGLGLLAPLLVGAPLGTALGLLPGAPVRRLLLWVSVGIVLWSALLTAAGALGLAGFETLRG